MYVVSRKSHVCDSVRQWPLALRFRGSNRKLRSGLGCGSGLHRRRHSTRASSAMRFYLWYPCFYDGTRGIFFLGTRRYQVGSDGGNSIVDASRSPTSQAAMRKVRSWMLLRTRHYPVGSDGGNSIVDASRNPTIPGWQRWGQLDRGCVEEPDVTRLAAMGETRSWMLLGARHLRQR